MNRRDFFSKIFKTVAIVAVVPGVVSQSTNLLAGETIFSVKPIKTFSELPNDCEFSIIYDAATPDSDKAMWLECATDTKGNVYIMDIWESDKYSAERCL